MGVGRDAPAIDNETLDNRKWSLIPRAFYRVPLISDGSPDRQP